MEDFQSVKDNLQASLVSTIRTVGRIAAQDLSFQRTIHPDIDERLDASTERVLNLANRLLKAAPKPGRDTAPQLEEAEDIDLNWRRIVDVVDATFEKADVALDEYTGLIKRKEPPPGETETPPPKKTKSASALQPNQRNANITKPQASFEVQPDNFPTTPWKPLLTEKPHAIVPLEKGLKTSKKATDGSLQYNHPYETEIQRMKYPKRVYQQADPIVYSPMDESKAIWVDTYEGVLEMLAELKKAGEIAIDLEHHDFRTYVGLTCLMQISTRDKDWIVDTLKPWRHRLQVLNEVFADPSIIKVLHGAYMDVTWLQRDLGLYLNGFFDTHFASEALGYSQRSLAFLLKKFVDFDADKKYQLADWRIRPLPEEMFFYARSDTHFLLYIYDMVRNELVEKSDRSSPETDLIGRVLQKSRDLAQNRFEHPACDAEAGTGSRGWYNTILKQPQALSGEQFAVFRGVWKWRDDLARRTDESPGFVLSQQGVWDIARVLPPDQKALHSLLPRHAWQARTEIQGLWKVIQAAREEGRSGPTLQQFLTGGPKLAGGKKGNAESSGLKMEDAEVPQLPKSHLFGGEAMSSRWDGSQVKKADDYVQLPWQRLYAEQGIDLAVRAAEEAKPAAEPVPEAPKAQPEEENEFTLKAGRKRKRARDQDGETKVPDAEEEEVEDIEKAGEAEDQDMDVDSGSEEAGDNTTSAGDATSDVPDEDKEAASVLKKKQKSQKKKEVSRANRRLARAERKEKKKEKKAEEEEEAEEEEPFDYGNAKTVMHAKREGGDPSKMMKRFEPYVKADGVKGARKAPPIRGTRSATFRK